MNLESGVMQIHIEDIIPNRFQPRLTFDEDGLKELSDSIKEHGIIQPLVLRKLGNKYEIIAGERRYKAATMAGLTTVPAVIANIDDNKAAEVAIVENVQRRDLTAIEEARSYKNLLDKGYLTQEQLAKRMGLSQPAVANKLRLLNLDEEVQQALLEEKISERHARTLLSLSDKEAQKEWLHKVINERLTVRQLDLELKKLKAEQQGEDDEDESGDVPLVESPRDIAKIKAQATDIRDVGRKMTAEEIMKPTEVINEELETLDFEEPAVEEKKEKEETFQETEALDEPIIIPGTEEKEDILPVEKEENSNPFITATSIPESNIVTPTSTATIIPQNNFIDTKDDNKFFTFNMEEEPEDTKPDFSSVEPKSDNNSGFEIFNAPGSEPAFPELSNTNPFTKDEPKIEKNNSFFNFDDSLNTDFDRNPNNKFFTPVYDNSDNEPTFVKSEEKFINPMDAVNKLMPDYENDQIEEETSLKTAISTIRDCIESLGEKGFYINVEEIDFEKNYQITIQIKKDK